MTLRISKLPIKDLVPFAGNARRGDVAKIAESLFANGQYKPIVVNKGTHTGIANEVLAGNHTVEAATSLGWTHIEVVTVDVDRASAVRINVADNRTSDLATDDTEDLVKLLQEIGDLDGTGFTDDDLQQLLASLDVPDFNPDDDDDVRLDRKSVTTCPECGHTFTPVTRTVTDDDEL